MNLRHRTTPRPVGCDVIPIYPILSAQRACSALLLLNSPSLRQHFVGVGRLWSSGLLRYRLRTRLRSLKPRRVAPFAPSPGIMSPIAATLCRSSRTCLGPFCCRRSSASTASRVVRVRCNRAVRSYAAPLLQLLSYGRGAKRCHVRARLLVDREVRWVFLCEHLPPAVEQSHGIGHTSGSLFVDEQRAAVTTHPEDGSFDLPLGGADVPRHARVRTTWRRHLGEGSCYCEVA